MKIEKNTVVSFHYRVMNKEGKVLESSFGEHPSLYLQGAPGMLPGIVDALEGKEAGDVFSVDLTPEQAYGPRQDGASARVPLKSVRLRNQQPVRGKLQPGTLVEVNTAHGIREASVIKQGLKNVDIDTNHPFAGLELSFDVEIVDVRAASKEEISHGHAHGVGGHQH